MESNREDRPVDPDKRGGDASPTQLPVGEDEVGGDLETRLGGKTSTPPSSADETRGGLRVGGDLETRGADEEEAEASPQPDED